MICIHIQNCDWPVLFLTFAMNTTQVGFESLFPWQLSATNCAFVVWSILVNCFYIKWTHSIIAFNEGERILIMSFNGNHSWGFYVPRGSIVMPCDFRHWAPFWTGWLAGYVAQIASISYANVFLAAFSWRHPFLSCAISTIKKFLPGIECREVRIKLCTSLETAISRFSLLANDNSQKIHEIMPMIGNKEDSIWCLSLNVLFNGWSLVHQVISFLNCFF